MDLTITHEQADFDAVASQLGVFMLDASIIPVQPSRLNRNVRAFLTLYSPELPFVQRSDLPSEPIGTITLVDTQSLVTPKGITPDTKIRIIDHHNQRDNLPEGWNATIQPTGATVTILVEAIQEKRARISPIQATLLLLGIYEDTGSLTYTRTTTRDILAAAYLVEHGASLSIASGYLNHPLSLAQQELYDALREKAQHLNIHGKAIVVASGDAMDLREELSTIAHKLRDLLDPDGLFLLLSIRGGIQLIGRSTSDNVDAAEIASHFGGGGHPRAAAALIKEGSLPQAETELLTLLPKVVRPAITVAQIMSRGLQTIDPGTSVQSVHQLMQREGYEGYPVVENGKVVGLLTRRAVDRALSHKLNLPARSLMRAGEITILPNDPIEHLQHIMTDSGWGQIPVLDPNTRGVIGIVTRTDLLKTLAPEPVIPGYRNLSNRLEGALPASHLELLHIVAEAAAAQRRRLYIVGGFVRDLLLKRPSVDYDLVVEGDAPGLARELAKKYGGRVTTHRRFGTAKWVVPDEDEPEDNKARLPRPIPKTLDLVTARTEFYSHPTALPTVRQSSIKLDLHRRDFTINTLALRLDGRHYGEVHDYWGGYADIQQGVIRALHSLSFVDDPTRMLRAVRFEQRFGFEIEARTLELIQNALRPPSGSGQALLDRVSGDRMRHELDIILQEPHAAKMLARLHKLGLLGAIHPKLPWNEEIQALIENHGSKDTAVWGFSNLWKGEIFNVALGYFLWLIGIPRDAARDVVRRLKLSRNLEAALTAGHALWKNLEPIKDLPPSEIVTIFDPVPDIALFALSQTTEDDAIQDKFHKYAGEWRHIRPHITGNDLRARGLSPGPHYKIILTKLRAAWLDGLISSQEEETAYFNLLLKEKIEA